MIGTECFQELSPPALSLATILAESRPEEPVLLILSPGTDPGQVSCLQQHVNQIC